MDVPSLVQNYLAERGISIEAALSYAVEFDSSVDPLITGHRLAIKKEAAQKRFAQSQNLIWFPCRSIETGQIEQWILRPLPQSGEAKFLNTYGGTALPFVSLELREIRTKTNKPLCFTEGPVKALALLQNGFNAIGIAGVWNGTTRNSEGDRPIELAHHLDGIGWKGRSVFLAFDADSETNQTVRQALLRLYVSLYAKGAVVRVLRWPLSEGKGIDDYIAHKAGLDLARQHEVLAALFEAAIEFPELVRPEDIDIALSELQLAPLARLKVTQLSRLLAPKLKVSSGELEKAVQIETAEEIGRTIKMQVSEPSPDPVDGLLLLEAIIDLIASHVQMSTEERLAAALWIFLSYCQAVVDVLPLLWLHSPTKRCGKTTLLALLSRLCDRPLESSNMSTAAIYRVIENFHPTLLVDEVDAWLKDNEEARGVINSGHTRAAAYVIRCHPDSGEPERFSTWAPKALAGIGRIPETLSDRSLIIHLKRRKRSEPIKKLRDSDPEEFKRLRSQLARWALDHSDGLKVARPQIPDALNDRAGDNWFPLLAIAEAIGGDWPKLTRGVAGLLSNSEDDEAFNELVLERLREAFATLPDDFLATNILLQFLNGNQEMPWADWNNGNGISAKKLGVILKQFGVKSERQKIEDKPIRGYYREHLQDAFNRYLVPSSP